MIDPTNPWKTLRSRIIHQTPWMVLYEDDVIKPNGQPGTYTYLASAPFVLVVAYDGNRLLMVSQYRYPLKRVITEFPGGSIDGNEEPLEAAKRELREETGYEAKRWTELGPILNPNQATVFLAEDLTDSGRHEMAEDGIAAYRWLSDAEIDGLIAGGELVDSKTLAALLLLDRRRNRHREL